MIKIKFSNVKDFKETSNPQFFTVKLKNSKETIEGRLVIECDQRLVRLDFERQLTDEEKLAILKQFFYDFCISGARIGHRKINANVEDFYFIECKNVKVRKTVIEQLLEYDITKFNSNKKNERLLYQVICIINKIKEKAGKTEKSFEIDNILFYSRLEVDSIAKIINCYLKNNNYKGDVYFIAYSSLNPTQFLLPYYYQMNSNNLYTFLYEVNC